MNYRETLLALHLTGVVGPRRLKSAKAAFPELGDIFGATEDRLSFLPDWTTSAAKKVLALAEPPKQVEQALEKAEAVGVRVLVEGDESFPKVFSTLYDPPFVLWMRGEYLPQDENALAVIGCRKPSSYGKQIALKLSEDLARSGYTVVSGLARGIDSLAHQGALHSSKGRTLAFLGGGLLNLYPPENGKLAEQVAERGAVFSEYPLNARPLAMHFPQRNRLISGASKGVLVVEAKKDSGSFITVDHATDQGKPVFAVPGPIHHEQSEGTHALIQQGAKLVITVEDVFQELGDYRAEGAFRAQGGKGTQDGPEMADLTEEEKTLLGKLTFTPMPIDGLVRETLMSPRRLNELLLILEMKGVVQQAPGHCYFKV